MNLRKNSFILCFLILSLFLNSTVLVKADTKVNTQDYKSKVEALYEGKSILFCNYEVRMSEHFRGPEFGPSKFQYKIDIKKGIAYVRATYYTSLNEVSYLVKGKKNLKTGKIVAKGKYADDSKWEKANSYYKNSIFEHITNDYSDMTMAIQNLFDFGDLWAEYGNLKGNTAYFKNTGEDRVWSINQKGYLSYVYHGERYVTENRWNLIGVK